MLKSKLLVVPTILAVFVAASSLALPAGVFAKVESKAKARPVNAVVLAALARKNGPSPIQSSPIQAGKIYAGPIQAGPIQAGPIQKGIIQKGYVQAPTVCCKVPCITYKHHCTLRKTCCGCSGTQTIVLQVENPCTCCLVDVPVCVPDCCDGEPKVIDRVNVLGRGAITYVWCCGYKVKIVFDRHGDMIVHTIGR